MKRRLSSTGRSPWPLMSTSWWWILECPEDACGLLHQVLGAHGHHPKEAQTLDLSKILHYRIFRPKILHCQFQLISTVLVIKTKKWVKMEKFTQLAKILHCRRQWRHGQIPPLSICREIMIIAYFWQLGNRLSPAWCYIVAHLYLYKGNIIWQCASW